MIEGRRDISDSQASRVVVSCLALATRLADKKSTVELGSIIYLRSEGVGSERNQSVAWRAVYVQETLRPLAIR